VTFVGSVPKQALRVCVVTSLLVTMFCLKGPMLILRIIGKSVFG